MLYTHPGECVDWGACKPVCPVEVIVCEDDVPGRGPSSPARTRGSSTSSARRQRRQDRPLPDDTDHVASYVTSR